MNNNKILLFFTLCLFIISTACSVEKRIHTTGYHVDWNSTPSRLQQKELTLTKKHKTFNRFKLNEQDHQENSKPTSLNVDVLKTAENKPKTVKTTINDLIDFAKTAKIKTRGEIKPNTIEQEEKSPVDEETKYDATAIVSLILGLASLIVILISLELGVLLWLLALVFGIIALVRMRKNPRLKGRGAALTGMFTLPGIIIALLLLALVLAASLNGIE
jgi:ribosomal protein L17